MRLKPLLFLAGAAGAAAAVVKRRVGGDQLSQAANAATAAVPQPVKQAAQQAGETVQRAVESAPEPIQKAVDKVTPGDRGDQPHERYEPPIEAGAQPPVEPGGPPSDAAEVIEASPRASLAGDQLNEPEHGPPEGSVMPDTSADDPLVQQQTKAAAGDAGAIGGNVDELAAEDASFPTDPASRPVVEGGGDENEETFEEREDIERGNREIE
jgi:hypothetical protein